MKSASSVCFCGLKLKRTHRTPPTFSITLLLSVLDFEMMKGSGIGWSEAETRGTKRGKGFEFFGSSGLNPLFLFRHR